ncbi:MAG: thioredoxin family protein [Bacteroidales bacterium]
MNQTIRNTEQLQELISTNKGVLVYFYNSMCAPCLSLRPKVESLMDSSFPQMKLVFINAILYPELPAEFEIYTSPSLIVFFEGKEVIREGKYVSIEAFQEKIERSYSLVFSN